MFRIEKPEMVNKTFRLPLELVEELSTVAQNQNISLNNLVKQCCEYALNNLDDRDNPSKE
ncbi:toxin-antitoxin system HicB family antitoxin [bacterium]|nr:toxin-antitoxin system HicB family antitoxin [bacterium]